MEKCGKFSLPLVLTISVSIWSCWYCIPDCVHPVNQSKRKQFYCTWEYNATSDWITSRICLSIFCIISDVACDWLTYWFDVADKAYIWCKILCLWQINFNKCIRMGITIFKIFIWGGMSLVIWSEITFYADASLLNEISDHIPDDIYLPK